MPQKKSRTSFGEPDANPTGPGRKQPEPEPYVPPDEGVRPSLADMQHVYRNADTWHDKNGAHKNMRSFFTRKPDQFMAQMRDLEDKHLAAIEAAKAQEKCAGQGDQAEEPIDDMGTEEALRLIDDLYQKELAKVKCPKCGHLGFVHEGM